MHRRISKTIYEWQQHQWDLESQIVEKFHVTGSSNNPAKQRSLFGWYMREGLFSGRPTIMEQHAQGVCMPPSLLVSRGSFYIQAVCTENFKLLLLCGFIALSLSASLSVYMYVYMYAYIFSTCIWGEKTAVRLLWALINHWPHFQCHLHVLPDWCGIFCSSTHPPNSWNTEFQRSITVECRCCCPIPCCP